MQQALVTLENVNPSFVCEMAHHPKKDQHGIGQKCPLEIRHLETIAAIKEVLAQQPRPVQEPCIGKDLRCPCQDGDACHYKDCGGTKAWPVPQAEPVGEVVEVNNDGFRCEFSQRLAVGTKLFTTPPAVERPWVGLTEDEIASTATSVKIEFKYHFSPSDQTIYYVDAANLIGFARTIEAKLKELNHG
jgi:hypothetical protein